MSHEIIKNIFVIADRCVIVCHAPGNIQPQIFHEEEYGPLTELLRKYGGKNEMCQNRRQH